MIRATDFLKTAIKLSTSQDECDIRTSISRSYYAVHLEFTGYIKRFTEGRFFKKDRHNSVLRCFVGCSDKSWKAIAKKLNDLQQNRTDADYKIERTFNQKNSTIVLAMAKEVLADCEINIGNSNLEMDFQKAVKNEFQFTHGISI